MARRSGGLAVGAVALVSVLLVITELAIRFVGERTGDTPVSSVACAIVEWATPLRMSGWACLAVIIAFLLVVAMIFDTLMLGRRR